MQRVTIKDIAAAVGVSHTTVSYVLNGNTSQKISEKTKQAVLKEAKRLKYVPNETARSLRTDSTGCIAVALEKSVTHSRFGGLLQGIREGLGAEGYGLLLMDFKSKTQKKHPDYLDSVLQRRTDGIIYLSSEGISPICSKSIDSYGVPFVGCDCCPEEEGLASVSFDFERGAFEVACRLLGEGARRILYWKSDWRTLQESYREQGLKRALELYPGAKLEFAEMPYLNPQDSVEERQSMLDDICRQSLVQNVLPHIADYQKGDAVICSWGIMVKHLCAALYYRNAKDLKVAILSDSDVPVVPDMKILTSRPRFVKGGKESARLLLAQLKGEPVGNRIVIPPDPPMYVEI